MVTSRRFETCVCIFTWHHASLPDSARITLPVTSVTLPYFWPRPCSHFSLTSKPGRFTTIVGYHKERGLLSVKSEILEEKSGSWIKYAWREAARAILTFHENTPHTLPAALKDLTDNYSWAAQKSQTLWLDAMLQKWLAATRPRF